MSHFAFEDRYYARLYLLDATLAQSRSETQAVREFTDWVKSQPEGKRLYERYYHP